jgi:ABC-type oligopeptide transport system substrate-binding subunit
MAGKSAPWQRSALTHETYIPRFIKWQENTKGAQTAKTDAARIAVFLRFLKEKRKSLDIRDLEGAKRLLAEAGVLNLEFELSVPTYQAQVYVTMGEQLQAQLKEAGVTVRLKPMDPPTYGAAVGTRGEFAAYLGDAGVRLNPNQDLLSRYRSQGPVAKIQSRYNNPKLDELIAQQKVLVRDPAKRRALLEQIQRTVIEENILVCVAASRQQILRWNYVKDFYVHGHWATVFGARKEIWLDKCLWSRPFTRTRYPGRERRRIRGIRRSSISTSAPRATRPRSSSWTGAPASAPSPTATRSTR